MKAYQYFWQGGHIIGRVRAGTMGFDSKKGHNHWHFEQFAQYQLLNSGQQLAVRSHKVGFCIAPTDPVDLLQPGAVWQPSFLGFGGQCGSTTALWVQEMMPVGWGDTYSQSVAGQSFDISGLPNGTYYIEVVANPQKVLHESDTGNDVSLREVVLGGTPGHRTVRVPAWNGIDPRARRRRSCSPARPWYRAGPGPARAAWLASSPAGLAVYAPHGRRPPREVMTMSRPDCTASRPGCIDFGAPSAERDIERGLEDGFVESEASMGSSRVGNGSWSAIRDRQERHFPGRGPARA